VRHIQSPSAIFLLGIKLAKKNSLGVLNFKDFSWSVVNKETAEGCTFNSCVVSFSFYGLLHDIEPIR